MGQWHLYIVRCADNTLYTGIATDVARRFREHQSQGPRTAKYLRGRAPLFLVYQKKIGGRSLASKVELQVKRLTKARKEALLRDESIVREILAEVTM
jgi:putative endonuclease